MAQVSLKATSKGVIALIITAVIIFFGCVLAYVGAAGKLKAVASELETKQKKVRDNQKIAQTLEQSRLRLIDTQAQIRYLESSVSTQDYVPTLLKQIEALGKSVDLKVLAVRPEARRADQMVRRLSSGASAAEGNVEKASEQTKADVKKKAEQAAAAKPYDELRIDLEVEGRYMDALDFLYKLTSFPKIVAVNNLQMSPLGQPCPLISPVLNIKINVTAFIFKDQMPRFGGPVTPTVTGENSGRERRGEHEAG